MDEVVWQKTWRVHGKCVFVYYNRCYYFIIVIEGMKSIRTDVVWSCAAAGKGRFPFRRMEGTNSQHKV